MGPCAETAGLIFSRIHVTNSQGPPPKPLDRMDGDENQNKVQNFTHGFMKCLYKCLYGSH